MPFVVFLILVIAGISNGVNLTDGLDGLAIGCVLVSATALTVLTYVSSNARYAEYLEIQKIPAAAEVTVFCGSLVGASLGFLWYNAHPAEMFMGDVGSLALERSHRSSGSNSEAGNLATVHRRHFHSGIAFGNHSG